METDKISEHAGGEEPEPVRCEECFDTGVLLVPHERVPDAIESAELCVCVTNRLDALERAVRTFVLPSGAESRTARACDHVFEVNYGLYDTAEPFCVKCGRAKCATRAAREEGPVACVCGRRAGKNHASGRQVVCTDPSCWEGPVRKTYADAVAAWNSVMSAARAAREEGSDGA